MRFDVFFPDAAGAVQKTWRVGIQGGVAVHVGVHSNSTERTGRGAARLGVVAPWLQFAVAWTCFASMQHASIFSALFGIYKSCGVSLSPHLIVPWKPAQVLLI